MVRNTDDVFYRLKFLPLKHPSAWKLAGQISQFQTLNLSQNMFASHLLEAQDKLFNWLNMSSQRRPQRRRIRTSQRFYTRTNPVTVGLRVGLQGGFSYIVCSGKIRWSEITFYLEQTGPKITRTSRLFNRLCHSVVVVLKGVSGLLLLLGLCRSHTLGLSLDICCKYTVVFSSRTCFVTFPLPVGGAAELWPNLRRLRAFNQREEMQQCKRIF